MTGIVIVRSRLLRLRAITLVMLAVALRRNIPQSPLASAADLHKEKERNFHQGLSMEVVTTRPDKCLQSSHNWNMGESLAKEDGVHICPLTRPICSR